MSRCSAHTSKHKRNLIVVCWLIIYQIIALHIFVEAYSSFHHSYLQQRSSRSRLRNNKDAQSGMRLDLQHRLQSSEYVTTTICKCATSTEDGTPEISTTSSLAPLATTHLAPIDIQHINQATTLARIGHGNTFPNPAVGCILVRYGSDDNDNGETIGSGFHPKAGLPHAEVFALLEACGHVDDGVAAARSVMNTDNDDDASITNKVFDLLDIYKSTDGAPKLFRDHFNDDNVTAYVTLEPCCHTGQTPPCALSLVAAGVKRVVVGYRDPNPRVDGGGIQVLQNAGIDVHVLRQRRQHSTSKEEIEAAKACSNLVKYFVKRISPRDDNDEPKLEDVINGKKRRVLRSIAGRQKTEGTMQQLDWPKDISSSNNVNNGAEDVDDIAKHVQISHRYLERIDAALWDHEIALLRLNKVVKKKKGAKILGERIADELNAHVAQVIGHTALLYRSGFPPVLDLDELAEKESSSAE